MLQYSRAKACFPGPRNTESELYSNFGFVIIFMIFPRIFIRSGDLRGRLFLVIAGCVSASDSLSTFFLSNFPTRSQNFIAYSLELRNMPSTNSCLYCAWTRRLTHRFSSPKPFGNSRAPVRMLNIYICSTAGFAVISVEADYSRLGLL